MQWTEQTGSFFIGRRMDGGNAGAPLPGSASRRPAQPLHTMKYVLPILFVLALFMASA